MIYLDFWYFFFVFFLQFIWKVYTTSRNVSGHIYFDNSIVHSAISLTKQKL